MCLLVLGICPWYSGKWPVNAHINYTACMCASQLLDLCINLMCWVGCVYIPLDNKIINIGTLFPPLSDPDRLAPDLYCRTGCDNGDCIADHGTFVCRYGIVNNNIIILILTTVMYDMFLPPMYFFCVHACVCCVESKKPVMGYCPSNEFMGVWLSWSEWYVHCTIN